MNRTALALLALCLTLAAVPMGGAGAVAPTDAPLAQTSNSTTTTAPTTTTSTPNGTTTTTPNGTTSEPPSGPTMAGQVRINPVDLDADYLSVEVAEADATYNTTGGFAVFTLSEPVDAARIPQSPASAQVLEGGQAVKVIYSPDAAPSDTPSLYNLELYFEDGSEKRLDLYATRTEQTVAAAELQEWQPVIDDAQEFASDHGYGTNPEEVSSYLTFINDRADLVEGWLSKQAAKAIVTIITAITNPLLVILGLIALGGWMIHRQRQHGDVIETLQRLAGRYEQKIDRLKNDYQKAKRTADDDRLHEVPEIGSNADFYEDAFGTKSPGQLARLAASGAVRRRDGELEAVHDGVEDLDPDNLRDDWLEPVLRHGLREKEALNHLLAAVRWMETEHQLGHLFRDTRDHIEGLLDELDEKERRSFTSGDD